MQRNFTMRNKSAWWWSGLSTRMSSCSSFQQTLGNGWSDPIRWEARPQNQNRLGFEEVLGRDGRIKLLVILARKRQEGWLSMGPEIQRSHGFFDRPSIMISRLRSLKWHWSWSKNSCEVFRQYPALWDVEFFCPEKSDQGLYFVFAEVVWINI